MGIYEVHGELMGCICRKSVTHIHGKAGLLVITSCAIGWNGRLTPIQRNEFQKGSGVVESLEETTKVDTMRDDLVVVEGVAEPFWIGKHLDDCG